MAPRKTKQQLAVEAAQEREEAIAAAPRLVVTDWKHPRINGGRWVLRVERQGPAAYLFVRPDPLEAVTRLWETDYRHERQALEKRLDVNEVGVPFPFKTWGACIGGLYKFRDDELGLALACFARIAQDLEAEIAKREAAEAGAAFRGACDSRAVRLFNGGSGPRSEAQGEILRQARAFAEAFRSRLAT